MIRLFHKHRPGEPCPHMEGLLNRVADGSARGWSRWYALAHAARCTRCRQFLDSLREMIERLRQGRTEPSADVVERLSGVARAAAGGEKG